MENHSPDVSVIIPNYNYARYLRQRIESVLAQTYTDYEIILLDDASTDESTSVLRQYCSNPHVSHLEINSVNSGRPFAQWRKGIGLARGKYIWIAESDDAAEPSFLEKAVSVLNRYPDASFCFLGSHCIDESGSRLTTDYDLWTSKQLGRSCNMGIFHGEDYIRHNLYWRNYIYNASGAVFRKQCFEQMKDMSCFSMRYSGDWLFWTEMARQGMVVEIYEKLNDFRLHNASTTRKGEKTGTGILEDIDIVNKIEHFLPNIGKQKKIVRHGVFYKEIRRLKVSTEIREKLTLHLESSLKANSTDYYVERFAKIFSPLIPGLVSRDKDRM